MLVRTDRMRESGEPTYSFATTGRPDEFETIGRRFLGAELLGASPVRRRLCVRERHEAHRRRVLGLLPRARLRREQLPRRGRGARTGTGGPAPGGSSLDLGNGALGQLHRYVDPLTIDAVFLSHLHADHCLDLCGYYVMRKYHPTGAQPRIPVWGPPDTPGRMARAYDLPLDPGMTEEFDFRAPRAGRRGRPVPRRVGAGGAPRRRLRAPGHRRRPLGGLQRGHRALRVARARSPRVPTCSCARRPSATARTTRPTCT